MDLTTLGTDTALLHNVTATQLEHSHAPSSGKRARPSELLIVRLGKKLTSCDVFIYRIYRRIHCRCIFIVARARVLISTRALHASSAIVHVRVYCNDVVHHGLLMWPYASNLT
jgi:hypothetical protein